MDPIRTDPPKNRSMEDKDRPPIGPNPGALRLPAEPTFDPGSIEKLKNPLWIFVGVIAAVSLVMASIYAIYYLDQAPHRIGKLLVGMGVITVILTRPSWSLVIVPFVFPYIEWMPKAPVPGVNTLNLLMYSLVLSWVGRSVMQRKQFVEPSGLNLPLGFFLAWAFFSTIQGAFFRGGGMGALYGSMQFFWTGFAGFVLYYLVFNNVKTPGVVKTLAFLFCVAAGLGSLGILKEYAEYGGGRRVGGGLGDINRAGSYFACATLFTIEMMGGGFNKLWQRAALAGSIFGGGIGMLLPASRGAIVAFVAGIIPQSVRSGPKRIGILVVVVGAMFALSPGFVKDRLTETVDALQGGESTSDAVNETSGGRIEIWTAVIEVIKDNPVVGVGYGKLATTMKGYLGRTKAGHNLYLETAAEMGIPGLLLLLLVFAIGFKKSFALLEHKGFPRSLGLGYQYFLVALFIANLFGLRLFDFSSAGSFALLSALVFRTDQLIQSGNWEGIVSETGTAESDPEPPKSRPLIGPPPPEPTSRWGQGGLQRDGGGA